MAVVKKSLAIFYHNWEKNGIIADKQEKSDFLRGKEERRTENHKTLLAKK